VFCAASVVLLVVLSIVVVAITVLWVEGCLDVTTSARAASCRGVELVEDRRVSLRLVLAGTEVNEKKVDGYVLEGTLPTVAKLVMVVGIEVVAVVAGGGGWIVATTMGVTMIGITT